jgi:hypothetical protein
MISAKHLYERRVLASSFCLDTLTGNPLIKVRLQESHPGPRKLHEGDTPLLDEAPDKPFGASEMVSRGWDVQERSIDVLTTGSLTKGRSILDGWLSIHETPPRAQSRELPGFVSGRLPWPIPLRYSITRLAVMLASIPASRTSSSESVFGR